jgi:hypothetical protein
VSPTPRARGAKAPSIPWRSRAERRVRPRDGAQPHVRSR